MRNLIKPAAMLAVLALVVVAAGCSKTTGRKVNVQAGEYYTEAQLDSLSNGDKSKYCSALEAEKARLKAEVETNQKDIQTTRKSVDGLRGQITPAEKEILRLEAEIRTLTSQINQYQALPREYQVVANDCLSVISNRDDIYADATLQGTAGLDTDGDFQHDDQSSPLLTIDCASLPAPPM